MTAEIDIWNRALGAMGSRSTVASPQEKSAEAEACVLHYNCLRDGLLRAADFGFAHATAPLALLRAAPGTPENGEATSAIWTTALPSPPWLYSYGYPEDCIRFRGVMPAPSYATAGAVPVFPVQGYAQPAFGGAGPNCRWRQATEPDGDGGQQRVINTDVSRALGVYTRRVLDPDAWDDDFTDLMIAALAAQLAIPLSGDKGLRDRNVQQVKEALNAARLSNANEGMETQNRVPDWIAIRDGYGANPAEW